MEITRQNQHQRNLRLRTLCLQMDLYCLKANEWKNCYYQLHTQLHVQLHIQLHTQLHTQLKITRQNQHQRNIYDCICLQIDLYRLKVNE
jgi:hypothetical protein